ncbi:MAG: histidine kinase [Nitriliruptor sp.]|nr:MAG: histidine kinase [Nitriliruptor sp.]
MRTAAALSTTAEAGVAAVEAADAVAAELAAVGPPRCDLVLVTVTSDHHAHLGDVIAAVEARLEPGALLGAVATGVVGGNTEVEQGPGVAVWALAAPGGWVQPFRAWTLHPSSGGVTVAGWPDTEPDDVVLLLADPHSFPAAQLTERMAERRPGLRIVGGMVTGGPGQARLAVDGQVHEEGAVGVILRDVPVTTVVSSACRAIGRPVTVTDALGDAVLGLAGEPAAAHLDRLLSGLGPQDLGLLEQGGLQLGIVVDEVADAYGSGDFLLRGVLGIDADRGAITVGDHVPPGTTVQFHLRDPVQAGVDLTARLRRLATGPAAGPGGAPEPSRPAGALLFTCLGRGQGLFGVPDHDARAVADHLGVDVGGATCDGELGPAGQRSALHGFSAVVVAFGGGDGGAAEGADGAM